VDCSACRDALHDALQLRARLGPLEAAVRAAGGAGDLRAVPGPTAAARRRSGRARWVVVAGAAAAAIIAWLIAMPRPDHRVPDAAALALLTAPTRSIEGRISYAAADRHRPYEVVRAGGTAGPSDAVPLKLLTHLEERGDLHGSPSGSSCATTRSRPPPTWSGRPAIPRSRPIARCCSAPPAS
jgi:hypothetical protein